MDLGFGLRARASPAEIGSQEKNRPRRDGERESAGVKRVIKPPEPEKDVLFTGSGGCGVLRMN
jgi:hypothetical protein